MGSSDEPWASSSLDRRLYMRTIQPPSRSCAILFTADAPNILTFVCKTYAIRYDVWCWSCATSTLRISWPTFSRRGYRATISASCVTGHCAGSWHPETLLGRSERGRLVLAGSDLGFLGLGFCLGLGLDLGLGLGLRLGFLGEFGLAASHSVTLP